MDFLKGRGGRIKDLEEELSRLRGAHEQRSAEHERLTEHNARLEAELTATKSVLATTQAAHRSSQSTSQPPTAELREVERLLDTELARSLALEQQLATARDAQARAERRATTAEVAARSEQASREDAARTASRAAEAAAAAAAMAAAESAARLREAETAVLLERRQRETESERYQLQLRAAEASAAQNAREVGQLQQQLTEARKAASAAKLSASHTAATASQRSAMATPSPTAQEQQQRMQTAGTSFNSPQAQRLSSDVGGLASRLTELEAECEKWGSLLQVLPNTRNVDEGVAAVKTLLTQRDELQQGLMARDEELVRMQVVADGSAAATTAAKAYMGRLQARLEASITAEAVLQRQLQVLSNERDSLHRALTATPSAAKPETVSGRLLAGQQAAHVAEQDKRIEQLQQQLIEAQAASTRLASTEQQLKASEADAVARAAAAEARAVQAGKEADSLAQDCALLHEKLGRGEFSRGGSVRVLHLRMNPKAEVESSAADARAEQLQTENAALREQLAKLEQAAAAAGAGFSTPVVAGAVDGQRGTDKASAHASQQSAAADEAVRQAEATLLRRKVAESEKQMGRLKEVFKERITAFREACYLLFGYRVDMTSSPTAAKDAAAAPTTFSLRPQYCDDPDALLVFTYRQDRGMELVPGGYASKHLPRQVDTYIKAFHSIPAFTANLTIENFQKATLC